MNGLHTYYSCQINALIKLIKIN